VVTTTKVIDAEEEDDHPRLVAVATAAVSLTDRAGDEESAISIDRERVDELEMGENGVFGFGSDRAAPIYCGEIWSTVTEFPPRFYRSAPARAISRRGSTGTQRCRFLRRRGRLVRNGRFERFSNT
jgi:hypothetical protein